VKLKRRVLLRNFETGDFLKTEGLWTKDPNEAMDFESSAVAATVARELGLQRVEIVYVSAVGKVILDTRLGMEP
jgi:hypothetical protein